MSLSTWLRDYLYISLGGNRKGKIRTYVNVFITMLLGGLWHGAAFKFILWGGLHGLALGVHKWFSSLGLSFENRASRLFNLISLLITFHFVCFCWIFFRASSMDNAMEVIAQITLHFTPQIFLEFVAGYKSVLLVMLMGFILHFLPHKVERKAEQIIIDAPLAGKVAMMLCLVLLVIQVKSAGIQPFIYFQF